MTKKQSNLLRIILFPFSPIFANVMCTNLLPNVMDWLNFAFNILFTISIWFAIYFIGKIGEDWYIKNAGHQRF